MRRTPYTDRSLRENDHRIRQSFDKGNQNNNKQDLNRFTNSIAAYMPAKPHARPYHIQSRLNKPMMKRPLSVNRTYSELKHRSNNSFIQIRINKCHWSIQVIKNFGLVLSENRGKVDHIIVKIYLGEKYIEEVHGNHNKKARLQVGKEDK